MHVEFPQLQLHLKQHASLCLSLSIYYFGPLAKRTKMLTPHLAWRVQQETASMLTRVAVVAITLVNAVAAGDPSSFAATATARFVVEAGVSVSARD
jgi:hypothetical protein